MNRPYIFYRNLFIKFKIYLIEYTYSSQKATFVFVTNVAFYWCGRQDSNLHALALEPKSNESTNSTTPAYLFEFYHRRGEFVKASRR